MLNLIPKGGFNDVAELTASDKGKGRANDDGWTESPPAEPCAGPSHPLEQDGVNQASVTPGPEASELSISVEDTDETSAATDMVRQHRGPDAGGTGVADSNTQCFGPGVEPACHEVAEPKPVRAHKKHKANKDKHRSEISMSLVHGDCVVLYGDDFEVSVTPQ